MKKCASCGQKKGKRECPALMESICPLCCGQKRGFSIACPADCSYFATGSDRQYEKHLNKTLQVIDPKLTARVLHELSFIMDSFTQAILEVRQAFRTLSDNQILDAIQKFSQTCRTESKGLIYEQRSSDLIVQSLITALTEKSGEIRRQVRNEIRHEYYGLDDIIDCLSYLEADIGVTQKATQDPLSYSNFLAQQMVQPKEKPIQSRLILP
jgi:hypothetical protein